MSKASIEIEQRRVQRMALNLPVQVDVRVGRTVSWMEETRCIDISAIGAALLLQRPVKRGRIVLLSLPMPAELRHYDAGEKEYRIWGVVRRCIQASDSSVFRHHSTGIAFLGKNPPTGFAEHPSRLYDIIQPDLNVQEFWRVADDPTQLKYRPGQKELRKESRLSIPEPLLIELMDESGEVIALEPTVTENIGVGGAVVFTQFYAEAGTFLRVISERHNVEIISVVRGRREGPDGMSRLHIEFIDRFFPLEGIG